MLIYPAIDLRAGKCVRLAQGDFNRETVYGDDPGLIARQFAEAGAEWIHVVDLDGARGGLPQNWSLIPSILASGLKLQLGGGIRSLEVARRAIELGASRVVLGSVVAKEPEMAQSVFQHLGEKAAAGIDVKEGKATTDGWEDTTSQTGADLARAAVELGCRRVIVTDIATDGMQTGPSLELLRSVAAAVSVPVISSGGIGSLDHLRILDSAGIANLDGVIVGRALYEGTLSLADAFSLGHESVR